MDEDLLSYIKEHLDENSRKGTPVYIIGELRFNDSILSFHDLLSLHQQYPAAQMHIVKTDPNDFDECFEFVRKDYNPCESLFLYAGVPFYLFTPAIISESALTFVIPSGPYVHLRSEVSLTNHWNAFITSFQGKFQSNCLPLPIWTSNTRNGNSSLKLSQFKAREFITSVYNKLSPEIIRISNESGYTFGAMESELWFCKPREMHPGYIDKIEIKMNEKFDALALDILPTTNNITANWPLTFPGMLRGLQYDEHICDWLEKLYEEASRRTLGEENVLKIRRLLYINGIRKKEKMTYGGVAIPQVMTFVNTNTKEKITFEYWKYLMEIIEEHFNVTKKWPKNYEIYIILTGDSYIVNDVFFEWLKSKEGKFRNMEKRKLDAIICNWILFKCPRTRLLQYEIPVDNYPRPYHLFYYHDNEMGQDDLTERELNGVTRFYLFEKIIDSHRNDYINNPDGEWHIMTLQDLILDLNKGSISFYEKIFEVEGAEFDRLKFMIKEFQDKSPHHNKRTYIIK